MERLVAEKSPKFAIGISPRHTHKCDLWRRLVKIRTDINANPKKNSINFENWDLYGENPLI